MELLQLIYFCDAAKSENFSQTAKHFLVPPSAISQSVHRLEKEVGTSLFYRDANRVRLNSDGRIFYEEIRAALASIDRARARIERCRDGVCGDVRLFIGTNRRAVVLAIEKFRIQYPEVNFLLNHSTLNDPSEYDLVITHDLARCSGMERRLLRREKLYLAMVKSHPLAARERLTLADAAKESFISMHPESSLRMVTEEACRNAGFFPNFTVQSDDPAYVRKYVELGMGVTLAPEFSWRGEFSEQVILRDVGEIFRDTYLFFRDPSLQSVCVQRFSRLLCEEFER